MKFDRQVRQCATGHDAVCHGQLAARVVRLHWRTSRQWHTLSQLPIVIVKIHQEEPIGPILFY
jgi:hypothetical protein